MIALLLFACAPEEPAPTCDVAGEADAWVVSALYFARADEAGVSEGFNLDHAVSVEADDASGCGIGDYVDPEGVVGIDNGLTRILPALELTEAAAVEDLIQGAIADGNLLLSIEVAGLDSPVDDDCVDFTIGRATGAPSIGADGTLEWYQTLDRDTSKEAITASGVAVADGRVVAGGMSLQIPVNVIGTDLVFDVTDASVRVDFQDDGSLLGVLSGGVDIATVQAIADENAVDPSVAALLEQALGANADLAPDDDGACQQISIGFTFTAVPMFFFAEDAP